MDEYKVEDYVGELTDQEKLLLGLIYLYPNLTNQELATYFDVTHNTISTWKIRPRFKRALELKRMGIIEYIESQKKEIAENTVRLALSAKNEMVQFQASKFLLNNDINGDGNTDGEDTFEISGWENDSNS